MESLVKAAVTQVLNPEVGKIHEGRKRHLANINKEISKVLSSTVTAEFQKTFKKMKLGAELTSAVQLAKARQAVHGERDRQEKLARDERETLLNKVLQGERTERKEARDRFLKVVESGQNSTQKMIASLSQAISGVPVAPTGINHAHAGEPRAYTFAEIAKFKSLF